MVKRLVLVSSKEEPTLLLTSDFWSLMVLPTSDIDTTMIIKLGNMYAQGTEQPNAFDDIGCTQVQQLLT